MYLHHFLYSHTVFKSLSLFGFLCIILYERLPHIQAAELHQVPTPPPQCLAPTLIERLAPSHDICPVTPLHQDGLYIQSHASRVAELNETAFEKALYLVHSSGNGSYLAVLYHASWCPFSKNVRPAFDALSTMFPSIYHVAVEESSVRRRWLILPDKLGDACYGNMVFGLHYVVWLSIHLEHLHFWRDQKIVSFKYCIRCWIIDSHISIYSMLAFCVCHVFNVRCRTHS